MPFPSGQKIRTFLSLLRRGTPRRFLSSRIPEFRRVLLIESGSRHLMEGLLPGLYETHKHLERVDLVTCFAGKPASFDLQRGDIYYTYDWRGRDKRQSLYQGLREKHYDVGGMICSGEPIMTGWKWSLAWNVPAKYLLLNENGDYVWFDYTNWRTLRHFALFRMGLAGSDAFATLARIFLFPFAFTYLLVYASVVHLRRKVRSL